METSFDIFYSYNMMDLLWVITFLNVIYFISGMDDLFIDIVSIAFRLRPKRLQNNQVKTIAEIDEKKIAIIVPAWDEKEIISKMLVGNLARIEYSNYDFFVGVYPNDLETIKAVEAVSDKYSNVHAVINNQDGPTTKGQILNFVEKWILKYEELNDVRFDALHMQDAEDLIHPQILKLVNFKLNQFDFIQTPVYSLNIKKSELVAGTYMDEFAESHTKDVLVRDFLGAAIPSAGVGTTLSRKLIKTFTSKEGTLFNETSVTEDYELGLRTKKLGLKSNFSCNYYISRKTGKREYIATREYFPKSFNRSIRQKTRWITGISLQGMKNIGWEGTTWDKYFLFRDRKGLIANIAILINYICLLMLMVAPFPGKYESIEKILTENVFLQWTLYVNLFFMANRFIQRAVCVSRVYGVINTLPILFRWPVGCLINSFATINAIYKYIGAFIFKKKIKWAKTSHELPIGFENMTDEKEISVA